MESLTKHEIIVCDDDEVQHQSLRIGLRRDFQVTSAHTGIELLETLQQKSFAALLLDLRLGADENGFSLIPKVRDMHPGMPVIVHSGLDDYGSIVRAMRMGAAEYLPKYCSIEVLSERLLACIQQSQKGMVRLDVPKNTFISISPSTQRTRDEINKLRAFPGHVLIVGEPGSGKETVARGFRHPDEAWLSVDAGDFCSQTIAAFMGEVKQRLDSHQGSYHARSPRGGIIFIDEITRLSAAAQAQLLRLLDQQMAQLGSVRIISSSSSEPTALTPAANMRADLLSRLGVFIMRVPPLRARRDDFVPLAEVFLRQLNGGSKLPLSADLVGRLVRYSWPGNVRELANTMQYMLAMAGKDPLEARHLPPQVDVQEAGATPEASVDPAVSGKTFRARMKAHEKALLQAEYERAEGHVASMSATLDLNRTYLYEKLKSYKIIGRGSK